MATTAGTFEAERLSIGLDGEPLVYEEVLLDRGGRAHVVGCGPGRLTVAYDATLWQEPAPAEPVTRADMLRDLRQSRFCQSDALRSFAEVEIGWFPDGPDLGRKIGEWVHRRLFYDLGSSGPLDTAVDTLLAGRGVCRDFAHLTIALCRALGVPARLVSVYAPGLWDMDFHAVAEVASGGYWEIVDATRLAPRQSLVRIATGPDAAATAFSMSIEGDAELLTSTVTATTHGDLPTDHHDGQVTLR